MKQLEIEQINYDNAFLRENKDILPEGFIWLDLILKESIRKEDGKEYPHMLFLFDKQGGFILQYDIKDQTVWLKGSVFRDAVKKIKSVKYNQLLELFKKIIEHKFNQHVESLGSVSYYLSDQYEYHFNNRIKR